MHRWKARKELFQNLVSLLANSKDHLFVIHGFNHGTVLRDYIRGGGLTKDLHKILPLLPEIRITWSQEGATTIFFPRRCSSWNA